jgi:hypothetical protein
MAYLQSITMLVIWLGSGSWFWHTSHSPAPLPAALVCRGIGRLLCRDRQRLGRASACFGDASQSRRVRASPVQCQPCQIHHRSLRLPLRNIVVEFLFVRYCLRPRTSSVGQRRPQTLGAMIETTKVRGPRAHQRSLRGLGKQSHKRG